MIGFVIAIYIVLCVLWHRLDKIITILTEREDLSKKHTKNGKILQNGKKRSK